MVEAEDLSLIFVRIIYQLLIMIIFCHIIVILLLVFFVLLYCFSIKAPT